MIICLFYEKTNSYHAEKDYTFLGKIYWNCSTSKGRIFIPLCAAVKGRLLKKIFLRIVHVTQCVSGVKYGIVLIFFYSKMF